MQFKPIVFVLMVALMFAHESEGHLKLKLIKAKLLAAKAPHVAAHIKVGAEVKASAANAFVKTLAAAKAARVATVSLLTAPFRVAAKTVALKVGAVKAAKALKVAGLVTAVNTLKKNPIIVPVAVPVKVPFPTFDKKHILGEAAAGGVLSAALTPVHGLLSGAQTIIKAAGSKFPSLLPSLPVGVSSQVPVAPVEPIYRFIPNAPAGSYNNIHYNPTITIDLPSSNRQTVSEVASYAPVLHDTYGLPRP